MSNSLREITIFFFALGKSKGNKPATVDAGKGSLGGAHNHAKRANEQPNSSPDYYTMQRAQRRNRKQQQKEHDTVKSAGLDKM